MCEPSLLVSKLEQGLFQFTNSWRNDPGTSRASSTPPSSSRDNEQRTTLPKMHDARRDSIRRAYLPPTRNKRRRKNKRGKKEPRLVSKLPNRGTDEFLKNIVLYVTERTRKREKKKRKKGLDSETPSASQGCKEQKKKKKQ